MAMTIAEKILARKGGRENVRPGDIVTVEVDTVILFDGGTVKNAKTGATLPARKIPRELLEIVNAGGIFALLEQEGSIAPKA